MTLTRNQANALRVALWLVDEGSTDPVALSWAINFGYASWAEAGVDLRGVPPERCPVAELLLDRLCDSRGGGFLCPHKSPPVETVLAECRDLLSQYDSANPLSAGQHKVKERLLVKKTIQIWCGGSWCPWGNLMFLALAGETLLRAEGRGRHSLILSLWGEQEMPSSFWTKSVEPLP
jgi:hypothetical protein